MAWSQMEGRGKLTHFTPEEQPPMPTEQETGWALSQYGHFREDIILPLLGNKPWILGYAICSLVNIYLFSNKLLQKNNLIQNSDS
jgi:hypothetical protein